MNDQTIHTIIDGILESAKNNALACEDRDTLRASHTDGTISGLCTALTLIGHQADYTSWTDDHGCLKADEISVDGFQIIKAGNAQVLEISKLNRSLMPQSEIAIYQINPDRDSHDAMFVNRQHLEALTGSPEVDSRIYDRVYSGKVGASSLEDIFKIFNIDRPEDFKGHSLSVSDVIEVVSSPIITKGCYFCDSYSIDEIPFDPSLAKESDRYNRLPEEDRETGKVLLIAPGKAPEIKEMTPDLASLQSAIGGYIEATYPFEEPVGLIVAEEGKLEGMPLNRALRDQDGMVYDVLAGPVVVVGLGEEDFCTLTQAQLEKYEKIFHEPEMFSYIDGKIVVTKMPSTPAKGNDTQTKPKHGKRKASRDDDFGR